MYPPANDGLLGVLKTVQKMNKCLVSTARAITDVARISGNIVKPRCLTGSTIKYVLEGLMKVIQDAFVLSKTNDTIFLG